MAVAPNVTYTITYRGTPIELSSSVKASFAEGWNTINVIFNSDISLCKYEVRVTTASDEYGVGIGALAYSLAGAIAANTNHSYNITVNSTTFHEGDTTYRISMYALSSIDRTWDATSFLLTSSGANLLDKDGNVLEVYVQNTDLSIVDRINGDNLKVLNFTNIVKSSGTLEVK